MKAEETTGDGNCFFRAISRMVYLSEDHHLSIRQQAVNRIRENPSDYQGYILHNYNSVDDYVMALSRSGEWADEPVIRATADALQIQIRVISTNDFIPSFRPDNNCPTQTVYIGHIQDVHFVATSDIKEPRVLTQGGCTKDGITLIDTESINTTLSWILNLLNVEKDLQKSFLESKIPKLVTLSNLSLNFTTADSAGLKEKWYNEVTGKKKYILSSQVLLNNQSD